MELGNIDAGWVVSLLAANMALRRRSAAVSFVFGREIESETVVGNVAAGWVFSLTAAKMAFRRRSAAVSFGFGGDEVMSDVGSITFRFFLSVSSILAQSV